MTEHDLKVLRDLRGCIRNMCRPNLWIDEPDNPMYDPIQVCNSDLGQWHLYQLEDLICRMSNSATSPAETDTKTSAISTECEKSARNPPAQDGHSASPQTTTPSLNTQNEVIINPLAIRASTVGATTRAIDLLPASAGWPMTWDEYGELYGETKAEHLADMEDVVHDSGEDYDEEDD